MAQFSESEAQAILEKVLGFSKADECEATLTGGRSGNLRFARNAVSTSGGKEIVSLAVQSSFGKKTGTATVNEFDDASLEKVVRRAEEMAQLAPENAEYVEFLGPQEYLTPTAYFESTAAIDPAFRARAAATSIKICKDRKLEAAGFLQDDAGFTAVANTRGLKGYHRSSGLDFSVTVAPRTARAPATASAITTTRRSSTPAASRASRRTRRRVPVRRARSSPASTPSFSSPLPPSI